MNEAQLKHGAFSWTELMTTDPEGAKAFYTAVFGWDVEDAPMPSGTYSMFKADGDEVGGMMAMPAECGGMPPCWGVYVTVDDVDATAARVEERGGTVLRPPEDIPHVGRFCVIQDPQGAVLQIITYAMSTCGR